MRFDTQVMYPHPVLRTDVEDYIDGEFQATCEFEVSNDQEEVNLIVTYDLSVLEIEQLIKEGKANVGLLVNCRDTFFRQIFPMNPGGPSKVTISGGQLHGEVVITPIIYATQSIEQFGSDDFADEFSGIKFDLVAGDFLAYEESEVFYLEREAFAPVEAIITLTADSTKDGYEWEVGLENDMIEIIVSSTLSESVQKARNNPQHVVTLINSLYFAAINAAVDFLQDSGDDLDLKWANVIRQKCISHGISNYETEEAYLITQRLLHHPIEKLCLSTFSGEA